MFVDDCVSVVIPVYNAALYVEKAILSALEQKETYEVILIEDGSTDNSSQVCLQMADKYSKVKVFNHGQKQNRGAGYSRNLGIEKASGEYVAFLDADDFFLPDRFRAERSVFAMKPNTDGVYGALGFYFYCQKGEIKYKEKGFGDLTTLTGDVPPEELFSVLVGLHPKVHGYFSIDTLTLKRSVFNGKTDMFNNLQMHEDTVFFLQLSINCKLEAGSIREPVGMRGVHDTNRIINNPKSSGSLVIMWAYLYNWSLRSVNAKPYSQLFLGFLMKEKIMLSNKLLGFLRLNLFSFSNQTFFRNPVLFNFSCTHIFGTGFGSRVILLKEKIVGKYLKVSRR